MDDNYEKGSLTEQTTSITEEKHKYPFLQPNSEFIVTSVVLVFHHHKSHFIRSSFIFWPSQHLNTSVDCSPTLRPPRLHICSLCPPSSLFFLNPNPLQQEGLSYKWSRSHSRSFFWSLGWFVLLASMLETHNLFFALIGWCLRSCGFVRLIPVDVKIPQRCLILSSRSWDMAFTSATVDMRASGANI